MQIKLRAPAQMVSKVLSSLRQDSHQQLPQNQLKPAIPAMAPILKTQLLPD